MFFIHYLIDSSQHPSQVRFIPTFHYKWRSWDSEVRERTWPHAASQWRNRDSTPVDMVPSPPSTWEELWWKLWGVVSTRRLLPERFRDAPGEKKDEKQRILQAHKLSSEHEWGFYWWQTLWWAWIGFPSIEKTFFFFYQAYMDGNSHNYKTVWIMTRKVFKWRTIGWLALSQFFSSWLEWASWLTINQSSTKLSFWEQIIARNVDYKISKGRKRKF